MVTDRRPPPPMPPGWTDEDVASAHDRFMVTVADYEADRARRTRIVRLIAIISVLCLVAYYAWALLR